MSEENNSIDNQGPVIDVDNMTEEEGKPNKMKWFYIALLIFVLWLMFGGGGDNEIQNEEEGADSEKTQSEWVKDEDKNKEVEIKTEESKSPEGSQNLQISESYVPVKDIYTNRTLYNANTFRLALKGEFKDIGLKIKAKTENDLKNFLSVNLGTFSGTYVSDADFDKESPLEVSLDLKNSEKFTKSDNVIMWNYITPVSSKDNATVVRVYATVFDEKGVYSNNTEVTEFVLSYVCDDNDPDCRAVMCDDYTKSGGTCLIDNFGLDSAKNYIDYFTR